MSALIFIAADGRVLVVLTDSIAHCIFAAQSVAHMGKVFCASVGVGT